MGSEAGVIAADGICHGAEHGVPVSAPILPGGADLIDISGQAGAELARMLTLMLEAAAVRWCAPIFRGPTVQ